MLISMARVLGEASVDDDPLPSMDRYMVARGYGVRQLNGRGLAESGGRVDWWWNQIRRHLAEVETPSMPLRAWFRAYGAGRGALRTWEDCEAAKAGTGGPCARDAHGNVHVAACARVSVPVMDLVDVLN